MANDKKFTVKNGLTTQNISFVDDVTTPANTISITMLPTDALSFSGDSGQLFSITDSLSGTIFAVNDISGVPSIEVDANGVIRFAETFGNVLIGSAIDDGINKLQVTGGMSVTGVFTTDLSTTSSAGDLSVANGGTGASTALAARTNLDVDQAGEALALAIALG
jgi:hypothetical protein